MEQNVKILIADENAAQRAQLRDALGRIGYHMIEEASNGDEALQKIERSSRSAYKINATSISEVTKQASDNKRHSTILLKSSV